MNYKVSLVGCFGNNVHLYGGQTVKTQNIKKALIDEYGEDTVIEIDTYNWKKHPVKFLLKCIKSIKKSENVIILPAQNGVKVLVPLFLILNKLYHKKLFYAVIGGWLPELLANDKKLAKRVRMINKVFVETHMMKNSLEKLDIKNVQVMPNFKYIEILSKKDINTNIQLPLKICTFSRVTKDKGIEDAIEVVERINQKYNNNICYLDIYGVIDKNYEEYFLNKIKKINYINYKGIIANNRSVYTIKDYDLLLFPTYYIGEGFAGTLIDAMAAGVPAIVSDWKYNSEIIRNGINGYVFEVHNNLQFQEKIECLIEDLDSIIKLKENCIKEAYKYKPENVIKVLINEIER